MRTECWRTQFEPLPDITTYELALDMREVNASGVVSDWQLPLLGSALRHRTCKGRRMDEIARERSDALAVSTRKENS